LSESARAKEIASQAAKALQAMSDMRRPHEQRWKALQQHADGKTPISPKRANQAKARSSQLSITAYRLARHMKRTISDTVDKLQFGTNYPFSEIIQESLVQLVDYWLTQNRFQRLLPKIIKHAYFSSYHIVRVWPDRKFRFRPQVTQIKELMGYLPRGFEYEVTYEDWFGFRIQHISPYDFWVSTDGDMRICRYTMSPQDFERYVKALPLLPGGASRSDFLNELSRESKSEEPTIQTERDRELSRMQVYYAGGQPVELYQFEGNLSQIADDPKLTMAAITLVQTRPGHLMLLEDPLPRPYWDGSGTDYIYGSPAIEDFYPYPRSIFEDYQPFAQHQAEIYNLMVDGIALRISQPYELAPSVWGDPAQPGGSTRYLWPGRALLNANIGLKKVAQMVDIQQMPSEGFQLLAALDRKLQELGVSEITQGLPTSKGKPTATEIKFKSGYTDENRIDYIETLEETLLEPLVLKLVGLVAQFQYDFSKDSDMLSLLGEHACGSLDALTTEQRISIAQSTRAIRVEGLSATAKSRQNLQNMMAFLGAIGSLPKDAIQFYADKQTRLNLTELIRIAAEGMPFDTSRLIERVEAPTQGAKQIAELLARREAAGGLQGPPGSTAGAPVAAGASESVLPPAGGTPAGMV